MKKHLKIIARVLLIPPVAIATLWAAGALAYDGPGPVIAIIATVLLIGFMVWRKCSKQACVVWLLCFALTTNCTTAIRTQNQAGDRLPLDWRLLVNGRGDEMMFDHGMLDTRGLSFPELRKRSHANAAIRSAGNAPDFSVRIRSEQ